MLCRFGSIVSIKRGASPRPIKSHLTNSEDGVNWIKIGDALPGDIYINSTAQKIKKESIDKSVFLKKGALILSNSISFGRPYILNIDGCIHDGWLAIEIYDNSINKEFLQYILQGYMWYFKSKASGSGVDNLNIDKVKDMPFALPPIKEQKRILNKLRKIDEFLKKIDVAYDEIQNYAEAIKHKILNLYFGENSSYKSYYEKGVTKATQLSTVCKLYTGNSISKENKAKKYTFSEMIGLPYIGTKDVKTNNSIDYNNGVYIPPADQNDFAIAPKNSILLCIEGGSAGRKIAITNQNLCFGNKLCCFAPKGVETQYLFYFLQSNQFKRFFTKNTSGIIGGVSINKLRKIQINLPHYEEQQKIARLITKIFGNLNSIYE